MSGAWRRWVEWTSREGPALPLALVRVAVCVVLLGDLAAAYLDGVGWAPWLPAAVGGLAAEPGAWYLDRGLGALLGPDVGGPAALLVCAGALVLGAVGLATRPALLVAALAHAQLAYLDDPADRGVDRLLRIALLVCALGASDARLTPFGPRRDRVLAWPADLLRATLTTVYVGAGLAKLTTQAGWLTGGDPPVLARALADPLVGRLDPAFLVAHPTASAAAGAAVVLFELSAPLLWTRHARAWALAGVAFHVGTALVLDLGIFPWGVLALYPALLVPPRSRSRVAGGIPRV